LIAERREALKNGDEKKYEQIVMATVQEEEMLVQTKLLQIIEKLGISEQEFQYNTMYHGQDQSKGMQLMQMQQQTVAAMDTTDSAPPLSKQKTIDTFKMQQDIQLESMDHMLREGMGQEPNS
jgi:hypothetical protein